jgi:hypothetical protein
LAEEIGIGGDDLAHNLAHVGTAEQQVFLADDFRIQARGGVADDGVRAAREDVIRANQKKPFLALRGNRPLDCGNDLLVGGRSRVDDVR